MWQPCGKITILLSIFRTVSHVWFPKLHLNEKLVTIRVFWCIKIKSLYFFNTHATPPKEYNLNLITIRNKSTDGVVKSIHWFTSKINIGFHIFLDFWITCLDLPSSIFMLFDFLLFTFNASYQFLETRIPPIKLFNC